MTDHASDGTVADVFDGLLAYWLEHSPATATGLGDHTRDHELDDLSAGVVDDRIRALARLRAALDAVPAGDAEEEGDRLLLADTVDGLRFELEDLASPSRDPLFYLDLATGSVHELIRREDLPPGQRQEAVAARAGQVARLFEQARANLGEVSGPHREVALVRLPGAIELFREVVPAFAPGAAEAGEAAAAACEAFAAWLETLEGPAPDWRLGEDRWPDALRLILGVDMAAQEVWGRAHTALQRLQEAAEASASRLLGSEARGLAGPELVRAGLERVARDMPGRGTLVAEAAAILPEIIAFIRETGQFDLPEPDTLDVEEVPAFAQGVAVAYFMPAPPLEPDAAHTYYLSPIPKDWDDERAGSFLREYNLHALRSLGIHEAYPGHYVQLAFASRHPRIARRTLWNSAFVEGWAVYVERQLVGLGYGGDELALTSAKLDMRSVANALLDQGLHVHGWDDETALRLMIDDAYQERSEAVGKLVRGKVTAGQLSSYFVGSEEMDDLRAAVAAARGPGFDALGFHRGVMAQGSPPFGALRRALLDEQLTAGEVSETR